MIYKAGTVQVTRGSTTVTGNSTEFLKYVSSFSMFRRTGDTSTYIVDRVISQTELLLSTPYQGVSYTDTRYSINPDRTTNLGLPLLSPSLPDPSFVVNQALEKIDKNAGAFLDFNSLSDVTYSGETGFYIRNDYHSDELKLGRVIKLTDSSGEVTSYDYVANNSFFDADVSITPVAQDIYYSGETGAEEQLVKWDVLSNANTLGYVFIDTVDTATNHIVVSGEKVGSAWSADDVLRCYGHTMGLGKIDTGLIPSYVPLTDMSGESLVLTEFKTGDLIYNYNRGSYRSILLGGITPLPTQASADDWAVGDIVYTVKADITVATPNVDSDVTTIEYGAQSQIGTDSVKKANIDFGFGGQQVWAEDIPVSASPLSATNVNDAITEVNTDFINHTTTGEAHLGNDVHFADDGQGAHTLTSVHMQDAVNEIKSRINVSDFITGAVDYSEDVEQFYSYGFINYPNAFMNSGERWCRMETGTNAGYVRQIDSFDNTDGEFNFASGEGFTYVPSEGDVFSVILTSELTGLTGDTGATGAQGIQGDPSQPTNLLPNSGFGSCSNSTLENVPDTSDMITNGSFDSTTTGWSQVSAILSSVSGGAVGNCLEIANDGTNYGRTEQSITTVDGKLYRIIFYFKKGTATSGRIKIGSTYEAEDIYLNTFTDATWTSHTVTFRANSTTTYIAMLNTSNTDTQTSYWDSISLYEVTPGFIAANNYGPDGWIKPSTGILHRVFTGCGIHELRHELGAAAENVFWPNSSTIYESPSHYLKFSGRQVAMGIKIKTDVAGVFRLRINDGVGITYSDYHTGGGDWEWLECTRLVSESTDLFVTGVGVSGGTVSDVAYYKEPMLIYGSVIGEGNYSQPVGEVVWCDATNIDLNDYVSASVSADVDIDIEAQTNGMIPKGFKAINMNMRGLCGTANKYISLGAYDLRVYSQVVSGVNAGSNWVKDHDNDGKIALQRNDTFSGITIGITGVQVS